MGGDICMVMADSHCCVEEANTVLQNYSPIKNKKEFLGLEKMEGIRQMSSPGFSKSFLPKPSFPPVPEKKGPL